MTSERLVVLQKLKTLRERTRAEEESLQ